MKIAILTFAKGDNYGAVLQSYALGEWLRKKGHEVEYLYLTWTTVRYRITSSLTPLRRNFESFRKKYLRNFSKECHNKSDLQKAVVGKDLVIAGSDQVWNPGITTWRACFYFLDFVPDNIRKISYAASFGKDVWEWPEMTHKVKSLLEKFDAVSVREKEGAKLCKEIFNVDAKVVLDPSFLIRDYKSLIQKPKYADHIVGFMFNPSKSYYDLLGRLKIMRGKNVLVMDLPSRKTTLSVFRFSISPFSKVTDWVTNIAYADYVVTDSFHCTAFAIIFKKQFIFIASNKKLVSRVSSLLDKLNIRDRIFDTPQMAINKIDSLTPINYSQVSIKLEEARKESEIFLEEVLSL